MITVKLIRNKIVAHVSVNGNEVTRLFSAEGYFSMVVTPRSLDRAITKALKWGRAVEATLKREAENMNGSVTIMVEGSNQVVKRVIKNNSAENVTGYVDRVLPDKLPPATADYAEPSKGFSTATTVAAITGSAGVGAAVGIVNGGDLVDSAVGGLVGAGIDMFLGGE